MELKRSLKRTGMLAAAGAVGLLGALAFTSAAQAEQVVIDINPGNVPTTAAGFETNSCDQVPGGPLEGQDGWVFVLPASAGADGNFVKVFATFEFEGVEYTYNTDDHGGVVDGAGDNKAYIITPEGWTLIGAEALVNDPKDSAFFNLTHACPGEPGDTPSEEVSSTPPGEEESTTPGMDPTSPGEESTSPVAGEKLPTTGAPLTVALVSAAALAAAGSALFLWMRRRKAAENW